MDHEWCNKNYVASEACEKNKNVCTWDLCHEADNLKLNKHCRYEYC